MIQQDLLDYRRSKGIHITAYMPLGGDAAPGGAKVLEDPVVQEIARKVGADAGQVLGSWGSKQVFLLLQECYSTSVLPKSVKPSRIECSFQVFDINDER